MDIRLTGAAAVCAAAMALHAEIRVFATVDRQSIGANETVRLTVTVEDAQESNQPVLRLAGFGVVQGPATQTQMAVVNGVTSSSVVYQYVLGPRALGKHQIGPIEVQVQGKTYRTEAMEVEVVPARAGGQPGAAGQTGAQNEDIVVLLQADKTNVYQNEQILLSLTLLYRGVLVRGMEPQSLPTQFGRLEDVNRGQIRARLNDLDYEGFQYQFLLIPYKTGSLTIEPITNKLAILQPISRQQRGLPDDPFFGDDFMNQFFNRGRMVERMIQSNPLWLEVKPLPEEGRPASFSGAVGSFRMAAAMSTNAVQAGEPVTLTVSLDGTGDMDIAGVTFPTNVTQFRVYDPETTAKASSVAGGRLTGNKMYKQMWVPRAATVTQVPAVAFSYFDPAQERYVELVEGPFPLSVSPAPQGAPVIADYRMTGPKAGTLKVLTMDILDIKTRADALGPHRRAQQSTVFRALLVTPPVLSLMLGLVARRVHRLRTDTVFFRKSNASGRLGRRLRATRAALRAKDGAVFYTSLSDALCHYIADHVQLSAPQVGTSTVASILGGAGVRQETIAAVENVLAMCDFGRFASSGFDGERARAELEQAESVLNRLRKELQ